MEMAVLCFRLRSVKMVRRNGDLCPLFVFTKIVDYIIDIQNNNYVTKRKKTKEELLSILDLTP